MDADYSPNVPHPTDFIGHQHSNRCGGCGGGEDRLRVHLIGDPPAIEHLGDMDAARAAARGIDIGNRLRGEQRA
jgi:hypothetical protein